MNVLALFARWGRLAGSLNRSEEYHRDTVASRAALVEEAYAWNPEALGGLTPASEAATQAGFGWASYLSQVATADLVTTVDADNPLPSLDQRTAATELVRQMVEQGHTVASVSVTVTVTASPTNNGSATWVTSTKYPDGTECVYSIPEDLVATVASDAQPGGTASYGKELISILGERSLGGSLDPRYPKGSATRVSLVAVNPMYDAGGGFDNCLRNGDFNEWEPSSSAASSAAPKYWTVAAGVVGVAVYQNSSDGFDGTSCMILASDGSTQLRVYQQFGSLSGTPAELYPLQQFAVCVRLKSETGSMAGTLRVALVDGSNAVVNDQEGAANSFDISLASLSSSWTTATGVFRTPLVIPSSLRLELRLTTPPANGERVLVDYAAMARMVPLYTGGPSVACFTSDDQLIRGDWWTIRVASTASRKSWHRAFDKLVGGSAMGIVLPVAAAGDSPTITSQLIDYPTGATEPDEVSSSGLQSSGIFEP